jgi:hypothetical protein
MKRFMVLMLAVVFLFSGAAFAAEVKDKTGEPVKTKRGGDVKTRSIKESPPKPTTMKAAGTVLAISGNALQLERDVKGKKETMDFFLVKVFPDVKVGDKVTVVYKVKDGKNFAEKVTKVKVKAPTKKTVAPGKPVKDKSGAAVKDKSGAAVESKR